jgi:hypothetical protein
MPVYTQKWPAENRLLYSFTRIYPHRDGGAGKPPVCDLLCYFVPPRNRFETCFPELSKRRYFREINLVCSAPVPSGLYLRLFWISKALSSSQKTEADAIPPVCIGREYYRSSEMSKTVISAHCFIQYYFFVFKKQLRRTTDLPSFLIPGVLNGNKAIVPLSQVSRVT